MRFLTKSIKLLADLLMLFFLIGSIGNFWILAHSDQVVPTNPDDLESVQITVKSLDVDANSSMAKLSAEEYPTKFILGFLSKAPNLESEIRVGQKVSVRIKKGIKSELPHTYSIVTYGLALEDGTTLFDSSHEFLSNRDRSMISFNVVNVVFYGMTAIPFLYFFVRILFRLRRDARSKQTLAAGVAP
jgi:hypothetical protein